ncbi:MAG: hypothetical protein AAF394_08875 [Planctomycetota bacterium]
MNQKPLQIRFRSSPAETETTSQRSGASTLPAHRSVIAKLAEHSILFLLGLLTTFVTWEYLPWSYSEKSRPTSASSSPSHDQSRSRLPAGSDTDEVDLTTGSANPHPPAPASSEDLEEYENPLRAPQALEVDATSSDTSDARTERRGLRDARPFVRRKPLQNLEAFPISDRLGVREAVVVRPKKSIGTAIHALDGAALESPLAARSELELVKYLKGYPQETRRAAMVELQLRGWEPVQVATAMELSHGTIERKLELMSSLAADNGLNATPWLTWLADSEEPIIRQRARELLQQQNVAR